MRELYISIAAAEGNIGDIYIRREALRAITKAGVVPFVYVGSMRSSYVDAFHISPERFVTSSPGRFLRRMVWAIGFRRAVIAMSPGPAALGNSMRAIVKHIGVAVMFAVARLCGSKVLVLGRSVRESNRVSLFAEQMMARAAHMYLVRDEQSVHLIGDRARFVPDLAFVNFVSSADNFQRPFVAISLRHDRFVDDDAFEALVAEIRAAGYDPILVTQVKEDALRHRMISEKWGLQHVDWPESRTHREHEAVLFDCYHRSTAAVSDRLHVLILAARSGAIPVIVDVVNEQKLHTSLDAILAPQSVFLSSQGSSCELDLSESERLRIKAAMSSASAKLESALTDVHRVVS
ncbi:MULTISPECIES: polysaccharide pyruvyl transferase family protein [unclassified Rhodococcus (in: high G+C Gram-positive bacteria)]|uniref:polysaccharide pyruvyl transferase family protein n=1 Tax=unclassified Rhodococcus (in: high G+C Gram-positive bacteria) TaxID=192944 RepID=UPI0009FEAEA3|nr:polysaccharide pyruvyl transferase family protein [Rhodococcus sp. DK17]